jgi:hypothetical protein
VAATHCRVAQTTRVGAGVQVKLTGGGRDIGTLDKLMSLLAIFKSRITAMDLSDANEIEGAIHVPMTYHYH